MFLCAHSQRVEFGILESRFLNCGSHSIWGLVTKCGVHKTVGNSERFLNEQQPKMYSKSKAQKTQGVGGNACPIKLYFPGEKSYYRK